MKKYVLFSVLILAVSVVLFLLKATGMAAHIALSVVGLALLVVYAVATEHKSGFFSFALSVCLQLPPAHNQYIPSRKLEYILLYPWRQQTVQQCRCR